VSNSTQTSSLELLMDSYMPEMALSSKLNILLGSFNETTDSEVYCIQCAVHCPIMESLSHGKDGLDKERYKLRQLIRWIGGKQREAPREQGTKPEGRCIARQDKTRRATDNERTLIYWEGTPRDPWHQRRARGPTPYSPPQMVTSASPIQKPTMDPSTNSPSKSPTKVLQSPTRSVCGYNVAAGATGCMQIFCSFRGGNRKYFWNFRF
jgi:hypothetical protein